MPKEKFSLRLYNALSYRGMTQTELCKKTGITKSAMSQYLKGSFEPKRNRISAISKALNVSEAWLVGFDVPMEKSDNEQITNKSEKITISDPGKDTVEFPVIYDITSMSDTLKNEIQSTEIIQIPVKYLNEKSEHDFIVISVKGNSMYPMYLDADKVLIQKQLNYNNGDVCAVIYRDNNIMLKKINYNKSEAVIELIPINPEFMVKKIAGSDMENLKIIGIPKLVIREL